MRPLPRRFLLLVARGGARHHVSVTGGAPPLEVEFLGTTYARTSGRTQGGWLVYREDAASRGEAQRR